MKPPNITIPARLDELLGQSTLGHAVRLSLRDFEQWIDGSLGGLFFFPEYSDHGPHHISAVLTATEALIRPEAWNHVTSEDAAILVLAVMLHDCAMHLTADGFLDLIELHGSSNHNLIRLLDEKSWSQIFDQFYLEARRWDQRTLHNVLGDQAKAIDEEEDLIVYIRHPRENPNPEDWSLRYRKFLGEFVRRNHARLAHEIALSGAPGAASDRLQLTHISDDISDLAGLVARSHNMNLRDTFGYLKGRYYGRINCSNSHPVFLMVLLRIADYLEIRNDRVSPARIRVQRLRSPVSLEEWNAHIAVHEVRPDDEDSEGLFVVARPSSARTFLKLQRLLSGLQAELDTSWAVLGEVFSKQGALSQLGITLRRVRSNLDDLEKFIQAEQPPYIPLHAAFDTAGVDLLKLLVKPLYGDRPEVGIRELLQNALDAVYELRQWVAERDNFELSGIQQPNENTDVIISIDTVGRKDYWLSIIDKGIGMTAETVRDYFLRAGSSYRQSEIWRRHFEVEGKSKVLRSGRFGIGVLAAFLLGNRIEVSTRHVTAPSSEGIQFNASIEDEEIEFRRINRASVGTTIRVKLSAKAKKLLDNAKDGHDWVYAESLRRRHPWDWFVLDEPKVERRFNGKVLDQRYHLPAPGLNSKSADWRWVEVDGYQGISWTYSDAPDLSCNGIRIESYRIEKQKKAQRKKLFGSSLAMVNRPHVSVFDRDGMLPLNLQRSEVEGGELPFSEEVLQDVMSDLLAFLLVHGPQDADSAERWMRFCCPSIFEGFNFDRSLRIESLWTCREGFSFIHPWHLGRSGLSKALLVLKSGYRENELSTVPIPASGGVLWGISYSSRVEEQMVNPALIDLGVSGYEIFGAKGRVEWNALGEIGIAESQGGTLLTPELRGKIDNQFILVELHFDPSRIKPAESPEMDFFETLMDVPVIPFDPEERRKKLPKAFSKLDELVAVWKSPNLEGWRRSFLEKISRASVAEPPARQAHTQATLLEDLKKSLSSSR